MLFDFYFFRCTPGAVVFCSSGFFVTADTDIICFLLFQLCNCLGCFTCGLDCLCRLLVFKIRRSCILYLVSGCFFILFPFYIARTTAFKTVRFDEITMQKYGINVESFDLSELVFKVGKLADTDEKVVAKKAVLEAYSDFTAVPEEKKNTLAKISVVIDEYIETYHLDALALRCWNEMEEILRVCPCVLLSELNDRGITASCEIDMCSAVTMRAMALASETPTTVLDWNNNYGEDENKVILFHCGPVPTSLMTDKGRVTSHKMFDKTDAGSGCGTCEGRLKAGDVTLSNCQTKDGKSIIYASEARFTDDPIEEAFFGCGGVCEIPDMQEKMIRLARGGFKHHTSVGAGHMKDVLKEAFTTYLGYEWAEID